MSITPKEITSLIQNRRSIFPQMYTDEPVSKEILEQILENQNKIYKPDRPVRVSSIQGQRYVIYFKLPNLFVY